MRSPSFFFLFFFIIFFNNPLNCQEDNNLSINAFIKENIEDNFEHYGLANFYSAINVFVLQNDTLIKIDSTPFTINQEDKLIISGRYKALIIKDEIKTVSFSKENISFNSSYRIPENLNGNILIKSNLNPSDGALYDLKYSHLWYPLKVLSNFFEGIFVNLDKNYIKNSGISIIFMALIFKLLLLPNSIMLNRSQQRVSSIKKQIEPLLKKIKTSNKSSEDKHNAIMKVYKDTKISPFFEIKPFFYLILPIPFLIAIFNVLGESYQLYEQSFLWIDNLSYPDNYKELSFEIPLMGNYLNLLPVIMLILSFLLSYVHNDSRSDVTSLKKQKINMYLVGILFALLFYPFPSALVMFWIFINIFDSIFLRVIRND